MDQEPEQIIPLDPDATVIISRATVDSYINPTAEQAPPPVSAAPVEADVSPADIEQTRAQMSGTLAAIGEKINPKAIAEEAKGVAADATEHVKEAVPEIASAIAEHAKAAITEAAAEVIRHAKETLPEVAANAGHHAVSGAVNEVKSAIGGAVHTAKGASMSLIDRIKRNPIPAAVAGLGLYWLLRGQEEHPPAGRGDRPNYTPRPSPDALRTPGYGAYETPGYGSRPPSAAQTVSDAGSKVGEIAGQMHDKAEDVLGRVHDTAGTVVDRVHDTAQQGTHWFQQTLQQNPLGTVAMAVALGTAIGLAIPETEHENRMMGETRDKIVQKTQDKIQNLGDKAQDAIGGVVDKVTA